MKKLLAGLFAAVLTTAGLVAVSGSTATAGPYTGTVKSPPVVKTPNSVNPGDRAKIKIRIPRKGNFKVKGTVTVLIKNKRGKVVSKRVVKMRDGKLRVRSGKLNRRGTYKLVVKFKPRKNSPYRASKQRAKLRVR